MTQMIDLTGKRYGRLLVVNRATRSRSGHSIWSCRCDCGNETLVYATNLRCGGTKSCGCLDRESRANNLTAGIPIHGHCAGRKKTRTYTTWASIQQRCTNSNASNYDRYGGQGIAVCDRWKSFASFFADMGERPEGTSIDRHPNNTGNYEPGNCRWATPKEQQANRRAA